jgi:hypothetical protein
MNVGKSSIGCTVTQFAKKETLWWQFRNIRQKMSK